MMHFTKKYNPFSGHQGLCVSWYPHGFYLMVKPRFIRISTIIIFSLMLLLIHKKTLRVSTFKS